MSWISPLPNTELRLPLGTGNPKGFGALNEKARKYNLGVDFETEPNQCVHTIERGTIVGIEDWHTKSKTKAVLIRGASGVICYGNITINKELKIGTVFDKKEHLGYTASKKLKNGNLTPNAFLRIEWYTRKTTKRPKWSMNQPPPKNVINPTQQFVTNIVSSTRKSSKFNNGLVETVTRKRGKSTSIKQRTKDSRNKGSYYHAPIE